MTKPFYRGEPDDGNDPGFYRGASDDTNDQGFYRDMPEPDQGDYTTLFEHLLPKPPKYPESSSYGGTLRSAARVNERQIMPDRGQPTEFQTMPDRGQPTEWQTMEQRGAISQGDLNHWGENLTAAVQRGEMSPERARSMWQGAVAAREAGSQRTAPALGASLPQTAASVTGQTRSIIDGLIRPQPAAPAATSAPRTAQSVYTEIQTRNAAESKVQEQKLAELRQRMSTRQADSDAKLAELRTRLGVTPSSMMTTGASSAPLTRVDTSSRQSNLAAWAPALQAAEARTGVRADALAAIILAENGGGQSDLSRGDNNYFSISHVPGRQKQSGAGSGGRFAKYATPQDSLDDFLDLVSTNSRYAEAWANRGDPDKFFAGLVKGGYIVPEPGFPVETWMKNLHAGREEYARTAPVPAQTTTIGQQVANTTTVQQQQMSAKSGVSVWEAGKLTPNQLTEGMAQGLDRETALAICGPAAAIAFARKTGRNPTLPEALSMAKDVGWTLSAGMAGPASQVQLLKKMGIAATLEEGAPNAAKVASAVQAGAPVTISAPDHYFVAERYDPKTGKFDFGESAKVLKASRGNSWFTLEEIAGLGMGAPRATIYMAAQ